MEKLDSPVSSTGQACRARNNKRDVTYIEITGSIK
jgi:hypothetical protein